MRIRTKIRCRHGINTRTTSALHVGSVAENRHLVVLAFDRQVVSSFLQQRTRPRTGRSNDHWRRDNSLVGHNAANAIIIDVQGCCLRARRIDRPHMTRSTEKVSRHSSAVTVSRIRFISAQLHVVNVPVRLEFSQLSLVNEFDSRTESALHFDVELQSSRFIRLNNADKSRPPEVSWRSHNFLPVLKHAQADQGKFNFRRETVVHADQPGRSPASPAPDVILIDDDNLARLALRQMKRDRSTHHAGAENDHVRRLRQRTGIHKSHAASRYLPFFQSRSA